MIIVGSSYKVLSHYYRSVPTRKLMRMMSAAVVNDKSRKRARLHEIGLTQKEKDLFALLKRVVARFNLSTTVRVAGGWVRDKVLGRSSHDIDIALDNMTGSSFAERVNMYLEEIGKKTHRIGVIQANPDQSKHLETATVQILQMDIDFVNLRAERYQETSRIPSTVEFGTPLQDAERRDFTINALFYNVLKEEVEDFTNMGMKDLKEGIIRTPLPVMKTFQDDPLRMLRAVRFASRFGFKMVPDLENALRHEENRTALISKVSRERVGLEFAVMIRGQNPLEAISLLHTYSLLPIIFRPVHHALPVNPQKGVNLEELKGLVAQCDEEFDKVDWGSCVDICKEMFRLLEGGSCPSVSSTAIEYPRELQMLAPLLLNLGKIDGLNVKSKVEPLVVLLVRDSLKLSRNTATDTARIVEGVSEVLRLVRESGNVTLESDMALDRECQLNFGRIVLKLQKYVNMTMCLAMVCEPLLEDRIRLLVKVINEKWLLTDFWQEKPLYNGKNLMKALEIKKGGTHIGVLLNCQRDWQILNRVNKRPKTECIALLKSMKDDIVKVEEEKKEKARIELAERQKRIKEERALKVQLRKAKEESERQTMSKEDINYS